MDDEEVVHVYGGPNETVPHYLETTSQAKNDWLEVGSLMSLVNNSLFCAHVRFQDSTPFVAEYPAKSLRVQIINGQLIRKDIWEWRIRLCYSRVGNFQGFLSGRKFVVFDLYHEVNYQHIFRSSLMWTIGYFRTAERDAEMRTAPSAG